MPEGGPPALADIAFAGDGEPTASRAFPRAVELARALRDELAPGVPLRLLTNGAHLTRPAVEAALQGIDEAWVKLDAGEQAAFERASGTKRPLGAILEGLLRLAQQRPVVVQSLFFRWQEEPRPTPSWPPGTRAWPNCWRPARAWRACRCTRWPAGLPRTR